MILELLRAAQWSLTDAILGNAVLGVARNPPKMCKTHDTANLHGTSEESTSNFSVITCCKWT